MLNYKYLVYGLIEVYYYKIFMNLQKMFDCFLSLINMTF